jgi:hypothetical protein
MKVSADRRIVRAISLGVFWRVAPSTRLIIWSRNPSPGFAVMRMTRWSERTPVPPVTALLSPPASRMTGADSPVMADSSTDAAPSTTSPSPGMSSPAVTTTRSPLRARRRPRIPLRAVLVPALRDQLLARGAQGPGLGLAATLRHGLGEIRKDHREQQPERDLQHVAERLLGGEELLEREGRTDQGDEHHRVLQLVLWIELRERVHDGLLHDLAVKE